MISSERLFQESTLTTFFTWATYSPAAQGRLRKEWEPLLHG